MSLVLIISTTITSITTVIFAVALKKYQNSFYKKEAELRHSNDVHEQELNEKQNVIEQHETQLSQLEQKINEFDNIDNSAESEVTPVDNSAEIEKYQLEIEALNNKNNNLSIELENLKATQEKNNNLEKTENEQIDIEEFLTEINLFQEENFNILEQELRLKDLQINSNDTNQENIISLELIINKSSLKNNIEYIASYKEDNNQIIYSIIFAGNGKAFLIDGELANFLIENYNIIINNITEIKDDIHNLLKSRIDFLTNQELKSKIITSINKLENINIENLYPCFYLPSENIMSMLTSIDKDLFNYAHENNIYNYSPAGIINLILYSKQNLIAEQNITRYQSLTDIIKNNFSLSDIEDAPVSEPITESETPQEIEENDEEDSTQETLENNQEEENIIEEPITEPEISTQDDNISLGEEESSNIDNLDIGSFLDGKDSNLESENEENIEESENPTENKEIIRKDNIEEENTDITEDENNEDDKQTVEHEDNIEELEIKDKNQQNTENTEESKKPSEKKQTDFANIDPEEFDIEAFLDDSES